MLPEHSKIVIDLEGYSNFGTGSRIYGTDVFWYWMTGFTDADIRECIKTGMVAGLGLRWKVQFAAKSAWIRRQRRHMNQIFAA